jgi:hypothetical protein
LTATNATVVKFVETGAFTINPTNSGNVVLTATFATASATDFIHVVAGANQTTGLSVGSPVLFSTPTIHNSIGCSFSNGVFSLPANKMFRLEAQITYAAGTEVIYRWRNITTGDLVGSAGNAIVGGRGLIASAMVTTTQPTTVRLEITQVNGLTSINANDTYSRNPWAYIKEIDRIVFSAPTGTTLFTPRAITGTGITTAQGRDNTVSTVRITGIAAGSEIIAGNVSASGGATVNVVDSGRSGAATINVVPNGADTTITYTQTIWRRTATATLNGSASTVNGAANALVDATKSFAFWLSLPAGHRLSTVPTVTNGTILSWSADGYGEINPTNAGDITITATSVAIAPLVRVLTQVNAGVGVDIGTIKVMMPTSGNRSWQIASTTGANLSLRIQNLWSDGGAGAGVVTLTATPNTWTYVNSSWNFGTAGNHQTMLINDQTSGRWFYVTCEVGASYNNNCISGVEY